MEHARGNNGNTILDIRVFGFFFVECGGVSRKISVAFSK